MNEALGSGPGWFHLLFVGAAVLIAVVTVLIVVSIVRSGAKMRRAGVDPSTAQADLAIRVLQSEALAPRRTTEERLAEIERLHAAGHITDAERAAARAKLLGEL